MTCQGNPRGPNPSREEPPPAPPPCLYLLGSGVRAEKGLGKARRTRGRESWRAGHREGVVRKGGRGCGRRFGLDVLSFVLLFEPFFFFCILVFCWFWFGPGQLPRRIAAMQHAIHRELPGMGRRLKTHVSHNQNPGRRRLVRGSPSRK